MTYQKSHKISDTINLPIMLDKRISFDNKFSDSCGKLETKKYIYKRMKIQQIPIKRKSFVSFVLFLLLSNNSFS